ncbi:glycosyltransferase family 4 protein [Nocardiopsis sp. HNM0947]|uniref:Glycosyltransferase family 4 protein n=1 Tax=Nocardiopsis coralli TaxID=2772213 RepID=A0ABR9P049_9ACTN|nr:glycosyltransferase family 4 protein [Nocardiopsis coralli]MBE2997218.1 glycosyltransferase family 4 protein [Nocardiopsis coralli]
MNGSHAVVFSREYPPVSVGGTSTVARDVARGLTRKGWRVSVASTGAGALASVREHDGAVKVYRSGVPRVYDEHTGLRDESMKTHRGLFTAAEEAVREYGPPDVVVFPDLFCYPEAAAMARRYAVPLLNILLQDFRGITPYDDGAHQVTNGVSARASHLLALEEKAIRGSDHTVFISNALRKAVEGHYPDLDRPCSVVHLGVDFEEIDEISGSARPGDVRSSLPSDARQKALIVACGRLVPVKGFSLLLRALSETATPSHLVLVGVGPQEERLRRSALGLGVRGRVTFVGDVARRDALAWMAAADVAVVPSLWESFCYVCAEMMAFARPVVVSSVDSINELVPTDEYGFRVPVSGPLGDRTIDPEDLRARIELALTDRRTARARGEAARTRVREHFTAERFAENLSALLEAMTGVAGRV